LSLYGSIVSVFGPSWLHFEPPQLLNFDFDADPDLAFDFDVDADPALIQICIRKTGSIHIMRGGNRGNRGKMEMSSLEI
jgi:hypothetical protein